MSALRCGAVVWLLAASLGSGCRGCGPGDAPTPGGDEPDAGGPDAGTALTYDLEGVEYALPEAAPIAAPNEEWAFVPVPEARCGNGSSTGMAVNLTTRSKRVLIFLAGGGACWEAAACALGTAVHLNDTMGEAPVLAEATGAAMAPIFNRDAADNPFREASFVYVPYCTGDLHGGTRVHTYDWFGPRPVHHTGATNLDHYLARLRATFTTADRVWLAGASAGGFGATLNAWKVQKALPWARVDVFNDSGPVIDLAADGRYGTLRATWGLSLPPGCADCDTHFSAALTRSAELLSAPRRYALLGYLQDGVIANYWGLSGSQVEAGVLALKAAAPPHVRTYLLSGGEHVVYDDPAVTNSTGLSARAWSAAFAGDALEWAHSGP